MGIVAITDEFILAEPTKPPKRKYPKKPGRKKGRKLRFMGKFQVGDKVYISNRAPKYIRKRYWQRQRVIKGIRRDKKRKCRYYLLGTNHHETYPIYWFRSYMLRKEKLDPHRRRKRKYHYHRSYVRKVPFAMKSDTQVRDRVQELTEAYSTTRQAMQ